MNIYIVSGVNQSQLVSSNWKDAQGSSLSGEIHKILAEGHIICVDKTPAKVKFFRKEGGIIKSCCFPADHKPLSIIMTDVFGDGVVFKKVECLQPL